MSILSGTQCASVKAAAAAYSIAGLSVIPLQGKKCAVRWEKFQREPATLMDIGRWDKAHILKNVGIVCGAVSRNLVVIDLDGESAVLAFRNRWPSLLKTYTVSTARGQHLYFHVDDLPRNRKVTGRSGIVEVRGNGCYVVAPPSIHPETGKRYTANSIMPLRLPNLDDVTDWLNALSAPPSPAPERPTQPTIDESAYGATALAQEANRLRGMTEGGRNDHLNLSAFRMGQLVQRGLLAAGDVERELLIAALATGQTEREALATIRSGLNAGMTKPVWR